MEAIPEPSLADDAVTNGCCRALVETSVGQYLFPFSLWCAGKEKSLLISLLVVAGWWQCCFLMHMEGFDPFSGQAG